MIIQKVLARDILDSRGNPTVEVDLYFESGAVGRAAVPSGASTGLHEAHELRDGDMALFHGKGVQKALANIAELGKQVQGQKFFHWEDFDRWLLRQEEDVQKKKYGANAILGLSLAFARAQANEKKIDLFRVFQPGMPLKFPVPLMNVLNGGAHASNGLDVQEFMVVPVGAESFYHAVRMGSEIFQSLKKILTSKKLSTSVGDEGGFAPVLGGNREALELLCMAIEKAGYKVKDDVCLALDVAATEFFKADKYQWEGAVISGAELGAIYKDWIKDFPIISIEDGFAEDDWASWTGACTGMPETQWVGDDLFVTQIERIKKGVELKAANALLVKMNQVGSLLETKQAVEYAHENGFKTVMSHRSGETEDTSLADMSIGLGTAQIKTGSLCRGERTAKYNQLMRLESMYKGTEYWGREAFSNL